MKLVVCVKQVPEITNVRVNPETGTLVREGVASILNPFCEYALDHAVRLKAANPGLEITAVSMGPPQAQAALMRCLELGADRLHAAAAHPAGEDRLAAALGDLDHRLGDRAGVGDLQHRLGVRVAGIVVPAGEAPQTLCVRDFAPGSGGRERHLPDLRGRRPSTGLRSQAGGPPGLRAFEPGCRRDPAPGAGSFSLNPSVLLAGPLPAPNDSTHLFHVSDFTSLHGTHP